MIDRRTFTTLLVGSVAAPQLAFAQAKKTVYYASVGGELTLYSMDIDGATLTKVNSITLPANIQYVWPHPNKQFLYIASSGGGPGQPSNVNFSHAFKIDPASGALTQHGQPATLPSRPIHTSVDIAGEYLLTAYNDPSNVTVHRINKDSTIGERVEQPNKLDTGNYAHQIRATPDNQQVILITRGTNAPDDKVQNPGSLKIMNFKNGILSMVAAVQPGDGMHFGPRHLDFHPTLPLVYVSIESQNKLFVYRRDPQTGLSKDPIFMKETLTDPNAPHRQGAGTIHMHPSGRFVYLTNRASREVDFEGKKVFAGGENDVVAYALDPQTGEPTPIQHIDGHGVQLRTFALDPSARLLVAASIQPMLVRDGNKIEKLSAGLSVYRMGGDGKLEFARKYDVDVGNKTQFWSGMVTLA